MPPVRSRHPALTISSYFEQALTTDNIRSEADRIDTLRYGFFGEIGGLLSAVKKTQREALSESDTEIAGEEIGDAFWYLGSLAHELKITPMKLGNECLSEIRKILKESPSAKTINEPSFRHIDGLLDTHATSHFDDRHERLRHLSKLTGDLLAPSSSSFSDLAGPDLLKQIAELFAYLSYTCAAFQLRMETVANDNLNKILSRWPSKEAKYHPLFDENDPEHEKFPRLFTIDFSERKVRSTNYGYMQWRGINVGDRLTDNSHKSDDYRFHDVFHLAYIAHLGWSPVMRALLKLKRKSNEKTDENEDGARAIIIEEGIATWIFNHAKFSENLFLGVKEKQLKYSLLKQIQNLARGYEVAACPLWQWEIAILRGFDVFRELVKYRGGSVEVDLEKHSLTFTPPNEASQT